MRHLALVAGLALGVCMPLTATATLIGSSQLGAIPFGSGNYTYTGLDGLGTTLNVDQATGASMNPISGTWSGLWLGAQQDSDTYTFSFNQAVSYVEFYITAQSTLAGSYSEVFTAFTTSAPSTASFTSEAGTAWDGTSITSTVSDGRSYIRFTSDGSAGFTQISFEHIQEGFPNGSVIQSIEYDVAAVPEPADWALMASGLAVLAGLARRRPQA